MVENIYFLFLKKIYKLNFKLKFVIMSPTTWTRRTLPKKKHGPKELIIKNIYARTAPIIRISHYSLHLTEITTRENNKNIVRTKITQIWFNLGDRIQYVSMI